MDIDNLINSKLSAMDMADKVLLEKVKSKQEEILKKILQLLAKFAGENGKIDKRNPTNKSILNLLNKELNSIINKSTFRSPVSAYLKVFDDVEHYTKKILESENGLNLKDYNLNSEKQLAIEEIANGLLSDEMLRNNIANPIKKIMYRHVSTGVSFFDAQKELTNFISNDPNKLGFAEKYVAVLTREAISRYDGMINQKVAVDFNLDAFRIVGSLIVTSGIQCVHMINQSGPFEGMAVNGKYAMSDLPQIINILSRYKGFVSGTNVSNYFINRNHWGCRHTFIPTRFLKRDKEAMLAETLGATGPQVGDDLPVAVKSMIPEGFDKYEKSLGISVDKTIFDLLSEPVIFSRKGSGGIAYYDPIDKTVVVKNSKRFRESKDMAERVVYHEFGHAIDAQKEYYKSDTINNMMDKYRRQHYKGEINFGDIDKELISITRDALKQKDNDLLERIGAVRDTIMSLNTNYGYGHSQKYFSVRYKKEKEFIAHLFENKFMGNDVFQKYLPSLYDDMLNFQL